MNAAFQRDDYSFTEPLTPGPQPRDLAVELGEPLQCFTAPTASAAARCGAVTRSTRGYGYACVQCAKVMEIPWRMSATAIAKACVAG